MVSVTTSSSDNAMVLSHIGSSPKYRAIITVLVKYCSMLEELTSQTLSVATRVASISPKHFSVVSSTLVEGATGTLLTELAAGVLMLLDQSTLKFSECECIPILGKLLQPLDTFNQLAPGAKMEDQEDLAWPGVKCM